MPRKPRVEYEGAIYHVMSRGNRKKPIFLDDQDCKKFLCTLSEVCSRTGWQIHAYVLMGNQPHIAGNARGESGSRDEVVAGNIYTAI
jgi:REP element-mobilizing transposase RayT